MSPKLRSLLSELRRRFEEFYGDQLVSMILYGSHAREDAADGSDIDVLAVLKDPVSPGREIFRTGEVVAALSLRSGEVISCLFVSQQRFLRAATPLLQNIHREGIEV